jgi:hypothetical protein
VGEGLVGFGHLVRIVPLLDGVATAGGRVHELGRKALAHGLLAAIAGVLGEPAHRQGDAALRADFDGHLVGGTTDTPGLHFELGLRVVQSLAEDLEGILLLALLDEVERAVDDAFGGGLLAPVHDDVHELADQLVLELGVGRDAALRYFSAARHGSLSVSVLVLAGKLLGRLTPYFERERLRFALLVDEGPMAPEASRVPRTTW